MRNIKALASVTLKRFWTLTKDDVGICRVTESRWENGKYIKPEYRREIKGKVYKLTDKEELTIMKLWSSISLF